VVRENYSDMALPGGGKSLTICVVV